jgi:hypothetical protein
VVHVLIIVDAGAIAPTRLQSFSAETSVEAKAAAALKQAIHSEQSDCSINLVSPEIALEKNSSLPHDWLLCPLTLNLPGELEFPGKLIYQVCQDVNQLRQQVAQQLGYATGVGEFWLPIVLTPKGPLYAEVIGIAEKDPPIEPSAEPLSLRYYQPFHLSDRWRQVVYQLGWRLLRSLSAPPATYLIQFGFQDQQICFDRLFPFPAPPAIASLGIQTPDLFTCHWRCLMDKPILDLRIPGSTTGVLTKSCQN